MSSQTQIFILGGTGRVGQLVIHDSLRRGIAVTALVRKEGILEPQEHLTTIAGSPLSSDNIKDALTAIQSTNPHSKVIVVSTLGQTRKSGNPWAATTSPPGFMAQSSQAVIAALRSLPPPQQANVTKVIQLSMFGAKASMANLNFLMRFIMAYSNMSQTVEDHNLVTDIIAENMSAGNSETEENGKLPIPFVMLRPAMLKFGAMEDSEVKFLGNEGETAGFMPMIQARDVARFLVDAVISDEWDGTTPVISN